jgi:ATP-dependent DNA helicase RecG
VLTLWRDWLTARALDGLSLNARQRLAVTHLKAHGRISNPEYQELTAAIKKTATRDLQDLKEKGVVEQVGTRGPGVHYVLTKRRDKKGTKGTRSGP